MFNILNGEYEANWEGRIISVTVPSNPIKFLVTGSTDKGGKATFNASVSKIKNNSIDRDVKVSIAGFKKIDGSGDLNIVKYDSVNWETVSGREAVSKVALGIYTTENNEKVTETKFTKDSPLWLEYDKDYADAYLGVLQEAESASTPSELEFTLTGKNAKIENFLKYGMSEGEYTVVFKFK